MLTFQSNQNVRLFHLFSLLLLCLLFNLKVFSQISKEEFTISLNSKQYTLPEIISRYVQIPSLSGQEKAAGEWLKSLCQENGLHITQMGDQDGNYNFAASVHPLSSELDNIIFLNHIDVVATGDPNEWKHPPFSGKITAHEIWGRGVYDNKGPAMMQLFSILEFAKSYKTQHIPFNVTFLAVSCEETLCEGGIQFVINNFFDKLSSVVVIGEGPPELSELVRSNSSHYLFGISTAHKRPLWLGLELSIPTYAHGSVSPPKYANKEMTHALSRLFKKQHKLIYNELNIGMLKEIGNNQKGIQKFFLKHPRLFKPFITPHLKKEPELFALFSNTMTLTNINSHNETINVIPEKVSAMIDCRLLPAQSNDRFLKKIRKRLNNDSIKISVLKEIPEMQPSDTSSFFYRQLEASILQIYPQSKIIPMFLPNFNDTGFFRGKGVNAYSIIPIIVSTDFMLSIHDFNERLPLEVLYPGKDVYLAFLENCAENFELLANLPSFKN